MGPLLLSETMNPVLSEELTLSPSTMRGVSLRVSVAVSSQPQFGLHPFVYWLAGWLTLGLPLLLFFNFAE